MSRGKPFAAVSLDVDNEWSYLKTHGDPGWAELPSYLDVFVPAILDLLAEHRLKITFFVVGQDAALDKNAEALGRLAAAGHEIGNHSFRHEPWLHRYEPAALRAEIADAEAHIERACGQRPVGFRGPGFSLSPNVLEVLARRGYLYDASTLPTYIGPLARAYYFRSARLTREQRAERSMLFGNLADGLRPNRPYHWQLPSGRTLLELPVTTFPVVKTPFHLSYLIYLARVSDALMDAYLEAAVRACRLTATPPSFLLHPLDVLGAEQVPSLRFFPGMDLDGDRKRAIFHRVLHALGRAFDLVPMSDYARRVLATGSLGVRCAGREG